MLNLEDLIGELLLRNNCVVIPAFGGFVAQQQAARIDTVNGWIFPPKKSILFNKQLSNNDGLLVDAFSKATKCPYDEANNAVKKMVQSWNQSLSKGERIAIDKVGFIFFDQEKNICFEQDRFFNLLLSSYGLGKVHFIAEKEEQIRLVQKEVPTISLSYPLEKTITTEENVVPRLKLPDNEKIIQIIPIQKKNSSTKLWKYVAAACLLPIAFYSVYIPIKTDVLESGIISFSDFNLLKKEIPSVYTAKTLSIKKDNTAIFKSLESQLERIETNTQTYQYNFSKSIFITVSLVEKSVKSPDNDATNKAWVKEIKEVSDPTLSTEKIKPKLKSKSLELNYIVGSFGSEENAKNLVSKLRSEGLNGSIVEFQNSLYRVSAGAAASGPQFSEVIFAANSRGYQGWVLK